MALTMARPYQHSRTGTYWLRKVVPEALRAIVGKRELKVSLRTKDPEVAKVAMRDALDRFDAILGSARAKVNGTRAALTIKQITAAVGVAYRAKAAKYADDPGTVQRWEEWGSYYSDFFVPEDGDDDGPRFFTSDGAIRAEAEDILTAQGITADPASVRQAAEVWAREQIHFAQIMARRAGGDWRVSDGSERFPGVATEVAEAPKVPLGVLLNGWAAETGKTGKALYDRERTVAAFVAFLGHDDAAKVTADDVVRWKEARIAAGRSLKTVANDLNELSPIWRWAKLNRKLTFAENPFAGLAPKKKSTSTRPRGPYSLDEAQRLLTLARGEKGALRWLPWLLCFTAARVGEACQSTKEDVAPIAALPGWWALHIHEDGPGRSLKTPQSRRYVPLHPALIREGFLAYVDSLPAGSPLFPDIPLDKFKTRRGKGSNIHAEWVRGVGAVTDKFKDPAHAWRHLFEDRARAAGVPQNVTDALMGHLNVANEAEGYGRGFKFMPETTAAFVQRMPSPLAP